MNALDDLTFALSRPAADRGPRFPRPAAPAAFLGMQECSGVQPDFALYNLTADLPGHPRGSTVSEMTLRRLGFALPPRERQEIAV